MNSRHSYSFLGSKSSLFGILS